MKRYKMVYGGHPYYVDVNGEFVKYEDLLQFNSELLEIIADAKVTTEMKLKYLELHVRMCSE